MCSNDNSLNIISIDNLTRVIASKLKLTTNLETVVYFDNSVKNWENVYFYCWNDSSTENNASWPGEPMTYLKDNVWKADIPLIGATHIIFDDGKKKRDMIKQRILHYLTIMFIIMILIVDKYLKVF